MKKKKNKNKNKRELFIIVVALIRPPANTCWHIYVSFSAKRLANAMISHNLELFLDAKRLYGLIILSGTDDVPSENCREESL